MRIFTFLIVSQLIAGFAAAQEMYFFETTAGTASSRIEDGKLVRTQEIKVVKPPRAGAVRFTSDEQGPKVIFTLMEHPPANWVPKCVVGDDILISQFSVERPKQGGEGETQLVLRHPNAQKITLWGNHLADFLRTRYDLLRYTPVR